MTDLPFTNAKFGANSQIVYPQVLHSFLTKVRSNLNQKIEPKKEVEQIGASELKP